MLLTARPDAADGRFFLPFGFTGRCTSSRPGRPGLPCGGVVQESRGQSWRHRQAKNAKDWRTALDRLNKERNARQSGARLGPVELSGAASCCSRQEQWELALVVLLGIARPAFDEIAFGVAAGACAIGAAWELALLLLGSAAAASRGVRPNVIMASAGVSACGSAGKWQCAVALVDWTRRAGTVPNAVTWSALLGACAAGAQWRRALLLFEQALLTPGLRLDTAAYNCAVSACGAGGRWQLACSWLTLT